MCKKRARISGIEPGQDSRTAEVSRPATGPDRGIRRVESAQQPAPGKIRKIRYLCQSHFQPETTMKKYLLLLLAACLSLPAPAAEEARP